MKLVRRSPTVTWLLVDEDVCAFHPKTCEVLVLQDLAAAVWTHLSRPMTVEALVELVLEDPAAGGVDQEHQQAIAEVLQRLASRHFVDANA